MPIKLILADERELFREGMKRLLVAEADLRVVGEATGAAALYALYDEAPPDVVILADELGGLGGSAVARELVRRQPQARVLLLAARVDEDCVHQAMAAGARGYALTQQPVAQVLEAVRAVADGYVYLAPRISHVLVEDHLRLRRGEAGAFGPCDALSPREHAVFELLVRGHTNRKISRLLGISMKTVETHRAHVLRKLGVHSIVDLVRFAARHQLPLE